MKEKGLSDKTLKRLHAEFAMEKELKRERDNDPRILRARLQWAEQTTVAMLLLASVLWFAGFGGWGVAASMWGVFAASAILRKIVERSD